MGAVTEIDRRLDRMAALEPQVGAMARVIGEDARAAAAALDAEEYEPKPLEAYGEPRAAGIRGRAYVAKDLIDTAGVATEAGSKALSGRVPERDATTIERLRGAGAVLLGKAHTHEFAYGVTTPSCRNPLDLDRTAGGSSGGSAAAVASGYADLSLGTDTIGSIRIPASLCGLVGLRPTHGRVPLRGTVPLSWTLDTVGPICRSVTDAAALLSIIAGSDPDDDNSADAPVADYSADLEKGVDGLTLAVPTNYFFHSIDPRVEAAVRTAIDALASAGATVKRVEIPMVELSMAVGFSISLPESADAHRELFAERADDYAADVRPYIELGFVRPGHEYVRALRLRRAMLAAWREAVGGADAVLAPTVPCVSPRLDDQVISLPGGDEGITPGLLRLSGPASVLGLPALSVPCHAAGDPLPIGLQVIGRHFEEAAVLRIGRAVEHLVAAPRLPLDARLPEVGELP